MAISPTFSASEIFGLEAILTICLVFAQLKSWNMRNNTLSLEQLLHYQTSPPVQIWQISLFNDLVWLFLWLDKSVMLQNLQFVKLYKFFITKFLFYFSFCICSLGNG